MPNYKINEGSFELPEKWVDQTINVFPNSPSAPADFSVIISRDVPLANEDLTAYFQRQVKQLPTSLPGVREIQRGSLTVDKVDAMQIEYTWMNKGKKIQQRQVCILIDNKVMNFTASATAQIYPKEIQKFDDILNSFKFADETSPVS